MLFSELQLKTQNAKELDFGDIFNKSIELFKKVWIQGLVMLLLTMVMMLPFYLLMYLPMLALGIIDPESIETGFSSGAGFAIMIPFSILIFLFSMFAMVVTFGMKASFYRICKIKDLNEATSEDYFYYLKRPYLGKVIKLSLMAFGISLLAMLLCVLPIIYVMVPIALMNVVFAFNPELSVTNIVKASFELGNKKWLLTFGLIFVSGLLAGIVGMLMCFIGIYITASFSYLPAYFIYKDSVGFENSEQTNKIEE